MLLNNTFYNDPYAIQTIAPQYNFATNPLDENRLSHVVTLAMDNIFDGSTTTAVDIQGQAGESTLEYNLYWNNATNVVATTISGDFLGNAGAVFGNPEFVDAATGNFELQPDSAAINAARSEIGPIPGADAIYPTVDQLLSDEYGTRTDPATVPYPEQPGASNVDGGFGDITDPRQILTLPGSGEFSFQDEWVPALTTAANSYGGPSTGAAIPGTYNYTPISGQRDILGLIRIDDPSVPITGYGKYPFFDIGAYQYVNLHPPDVTGVTATIGTSTTPVNFYTVGGKSGANQTPKTIDVQFNSPIDPSTLNSSTVELEALGVTGNNVPGTLISLAGKISYDSATFTLVISLGASGLVLKTDAYQLILIGSGSQVIASPQGIALSGANLSDNDDPKTGTQLPLPSGNGLPGSNFYDNFIINTMPPIVTSSTFMLAPASDTNIVGDYVTMTTLPSFVGSITEPNSALVPLAGQTAILDIGIAEVTSTGTTIYYADSPNIPTALLPYLRDDAGTAMTDANGNFTVTVGVDGAGTGLVTNTTPLPSSPYNVGSTGMLTPLPGTVSGYYVARVRVKDQSGNVSNAATAPFVVDTVPPVVTVASPANNSVINPSTASLTFVVDADKNLDLTHFTTAQIQLLESAPDGSFTGTGTTTIAINPTITPDYLDKGIGGPGAETLSFTTAALANGLYQLTLIGTGSNPIRDIAGNTPGGNIVGTFAVFNPSIITSVFVGPASFVTDPTASEGDRANPFPTISDALAKAAVGERIEVLPGVYTENVTLPPFVSIVSADPSSTDTSYVPGDALSTIIRAPAVASATTNVTVTATNLSSFVNSSTGQVFETEVGGFTIASPLVGNPAIGTINPNAVGLLATNSNLLIDRDYFIDAGNGILVTTSGASSQAPQIENDAIIGNINGVVVQDDGASNPATTTEVINNTFAFNTNGLVALNDAATGSEQAYVANNIFWQNHDQTSARNGVGVVSQTVNKLVLNNNLFSGNGASDTSTAYAAVNIGNGFDPTKLGPLAANAAADLGNFTGYPAFVAPYDPRPGSDGPATFFLDANFGLLSTSAAINNALESVVPVYDGLHTDLLGNLENPNPTTAGFHLPGYGPRDVGAFEYEPLGTTGTTAVGGAFRVVTTSLVPDGGTQADGSTLYVSPAPTPTPAPTPVLPPPITPAPAPAPDSAAQEKGHRAGEEAQGGCLTETEAQDHYRDLYQSQAADFPREVGNEEMIDAALDPIPRAVPWAGMSLPLPSRHMPDGKADLASLRLPLEHGRLCRLDFIEPADRRRVRGVVKELGVLGGDLAEGPGECVEGLAALGLGGLDHQSFGDDEGEIHGGGMEIEIDEPLADVHGADAPILGQGSGRGHELVHAAGSEGHRVHVLDQGEQIVGIQYGVLGNAFQPIGPLAADVAVGPEEDAGIAEKGPHAPDGLGPVMVEEVGPVGVAADERRGQVGHQVVADGDGPCTWAAAAVRAGEGLVRIVMHQVHAHVARSNDSKDRVHVGPVEIKLGPAVVQQPGNLADLRVEEPHRVGIGDHEHGRPVAQLGPEVGQIDDPTAVALDRDRLEAGEVRRGRVGSMRAVGNQDLRPLLTPVAKVGGGYQQRGELSLGAGRRLEADGVQAGDLGQVMLQLVQDRQQSLKRVVVLVGMLRRVRAGPPAARSAWGCTSSCTSRADRSWRRSPCSGPTDWCNAAPRRARSAQAVQGRPPYGVLEE